MAILTIDQGTTGTTTIVYDDKIQPIAKAYREFTQYYPKPGWVEHDANEIWQTVVETIKEVVSKVDCKIDAIGITNQRETTILWDKKTGEPLHKAIVWQCRRTQSHCHELNDHKVMIKDKTGLPVDPYFSGTKIKWLLDECQAECIENIAFGTIDTWIMYKLSDGCIHATDRTNASRTMLYDIKKMEWSDELCDALGVPKKILPQVKDSIDNYGLATHECLGLSSPLEGSDSQSESMGVPILAVAGDQQAALYGQLCFEKGQAKNTYGTGSFMVMNTGTQEVLCDELVTTLAVDINGKPCYALEGSLFIAGAGVQWLRDELKIIDDAKETQSIATSVDDNNGVYFVPAFAGLGAPYWRADVRGALTGLTRGAGRAHIVRAVLEAMAYQSRDVIDIMVDKSGLDINELVVDGGAVKNNFLMQFQSDILQRPVNVPDNIESTSLGVALMAGKKLGLWSSASDAQKVVSVAKTFKPNINKDKADELFNSWLDFVKKLL